MVPCPMCDEEMQVYDLPVCSECYRLALQYIFYDGPTNPALRREMREVLREVGQQRRQEDEAAKEAKKK